MRRVVPGVLLISACVATDVRTVDQAIIGGTIANPADYPSVVALESTAGNWFCTGTLVSPEWILTAAHCVDGQTPANTHVRFGDPDANTAAGGTVVSVTSVVAYPGFDTNIWDNDVALIKLAQPVTNYAPTPIHRDPVPPAVQVIEVGYGDSQNNNSSSGGLLREVTKLTVDCATTNDSTISGVHVMCMNVGDGKGSCFGDSGGPAFATVNGAHVVAGITSGGTDALCGRGFDIYTAVHDELAFIEATMGTTPTDPEDPGMDPTDPGSGSGTGSGDGNDDPGSLTSGCNTGGSAGASMLALAALALVRRRRR